ncbi:MAG: organoarsenical effux MFS transporter ArsJ [Vulcanococcus sp.]
MLSPLQQYGVVTANYWAFTLSDGALRLLVVFHFHQLGYSSLEIALLFLFYELFGIITNLAGGWLAARFGLRFTLWSGTLLQITALLMLVPVAASWPKALSVAYVMATQALSGIAKDLNKMSAKGAIKAVLGGGDDNRLFRWVAILTGSKNALKGVGFFLGGVLLAAFGFNGAVGAMAAGLCLAFLLSLVLPADLGRMKARPGFSSLFSRSAGINVLSLARFFLFGARDVWFVVALPVFLEANLGWRFWEVGAFLGLWVIGYGVVQACTPALRRSWGQGGPPGPRAVSFWAAVLSSIPALIALALARQVSQPGLAVIVGLAVFGLVFAINSAIHSAMVLLYSDHEAVRLNVGFYYMVNAGGRLLGTLLSGWVFVQGGLQACLWCSSLLLALSWLSSLRLPPLRQATAMASGPGAAA